MGIKMYDPPANMGDFDHIPGQRQQWSNAVSGWIDECIESEKVTLHNGGQPTDQVQFYNLIEQSPAGLSVDQEIIWNGFPRTLVLGLGNKLAAYKQAEELIALNAARPGLPTSQPFYTNPDKETYWNDLQYRPLDEYCEFRVERDQHTNKIIRVTFTSEPPEYWMAMHGDALTDLNNDYPGKYPFTGDRKYLLDLYHQYVSPHVKAEDLVFTHDYYDKGNLKPVFLKGNYNPYNKWNSTNGIMHLSQPNNFLAAEIQLGADATILRHKNGKPVVQADALVCCSGYGGTSRSSDPTIGASINDLARLGFWITIQNPVGLYMNDLNTQGFTKPNGESIDPKEYFHVLRGDVSKGMIERAVFEVPASEGFTVGDLKIAGIPIEWGGQIAEHMNIKIVGKAVGPGTFNNSMLTCNYHCCIDKENPKALTRVIQNAPNHTNDPEGYSEVFLNQQGTFGSGSESNEGRLLVANSISAPIKPRNSNHKRR